MARSTPLSGNLDLLAINREGVVIVCHISSKAAMNRVILEHVRHVAGVKERIVDSNNLHVITHQADTGNKAANASKTCTSQRGFVSFIVRPQCRQHYPRSEDEGHLVSMMTQTHLLLW